MSLAKNNTADREINSKYSPCSELKVLAKVILQNQSNEEIISDDEARRRREQLNRRPSYR
ncbi:unnamed protein product, partial [Acanthocheilonema viteae]